jgi:preprotein translocase subunit SecG
LITVITFFHVLIAILLIIAVLIQGGENVDIAAAFGGTSQAAFGPRGAVSTLAKITWGLAALFMATSISLSVWATKRSSGSILENTSGHPAQKVPAPAPPAPKR